MDDATKPPAGDSVTTRRRLAGRAVAAMASQVCTAGTSLFLQLIAAHSLGLAGYGAFALCLSLLGAATALYSGYVGDGLTVLDRHDQSIRRGLAGSAILLLVGCALLAVTLVYWLHLGGPWVAFTYTVMVIGWLIEETGRRVLMARLEFWGLVVNDAVYALATFGTIAVIAVVADHLTLLLMLVAMGVGAVVAALIGVVQLPPAELQPVRLGRAGLREVARFSTWRALQASLRPVQLLVTRVGLLQLVSLSAVGAVEAGRLVVAPIQTVINGAGGFLLPTSAHVERSTDASGRRLAERATALLVGVTVISGGAAALLADPLGRLLAGRPVPAVLVLGWTLYLATWAASLPFVLELVARKLTRAVFNIRVADTLIGLTAMLLCIGSGVDPKWTPLLLSTGGVVSAVLTRRLAVRTRSENRPVGVGAK